MESILLEILDLLRESECLDTKALESLVRRRNKGIAPGDERVAKKRLLPYYLETKRTDPARWASWNVHEELERRLVRTLQMKPGRTASGVATVTVLTKPWKCTSTCLYCPSDVRMPKSYLADEPACQRAERTFFDPYLQVIARLRTLSQMGHVTDKVELIVLGGTWSDYPREYQIWFAHELFRALNEFGDPQQAQHGFEERRTFYRTLGLKEDRDDLQAAARDEQQRVFEGSTTYNQAVERLYGESEARQAAARIQTASLTNLEAQHAVNETAEHRAVGLVIETRPDTITAKNLTLIRQIGCTKVQMGVQSLDERILRLNRRGISVARIGEAFALLRLFGFKIHVHFMANLYGATPAADKRDYEHLVHDAAFLPDEVKIYPCALVAGTGLCTLHDRGAWRPYTEDELIDVLAADVLATPPYMRISRMIRDISAHDILVGNKKVNLRQLVERTVEVSGAPVVEIRHREIRTQDADVGTLSLGTLRYQTSVSDECFLQWTTPDGQLAGFLRLSLPDQDAVAARAGELYVRRGEAMIREVHVYGRVAALHHEGTGAQHFGLGRRLVEEACTIARAEGFTHINVISSVGTRAYYRSLGFHDNGPYQQRNLR